MIAVFSLTFGDIGVLITGLVALNSFLFWVASLWMRDIARKESRACHEESSQGVIARLDALAINQEAQGLVLARIHKLEAKIENGLAGDIRDLRDDLRELRHHVMGKS